MSKMFAATYYPDGLEDTAASEIKMLGVSASREALIKAAQTELMNREFWEIEVEEMSDGSTEIQAAEFEEDQMVCYYVISEVQVF